MEVRAWTLLNELAARIPSVREPVASLSGGQRQTVAIARSLLLEPKLIMLDEPTAALGVAQTAEVLNLIERVRERGLGVIIISHNMEDVRAVADRIVVLRLGRNNGIFTADDTHHDLVAAITGASENAVSRRARARKARQTPTPRRRAMTHNPNSVAGRALDRADSRVAPGRGPRRRGPRLLRPRALGRPRHDPGGRGPRDHLDRVHLAEPGLRAARTTSSNLLFDCATTGIISLGIVCVLLLGEIDLSVGSMSGLASAILGVLWINHGWPVGGAILVALAVGAAVGALYATLFNRVGMPSFVATLAGLLALLGMQLYLLGLTGSINLPFDSAARRFGQNLYMPNWLSLRPGADPGRAMSVVGLRAHGAAAGGEPALARLAQRAVVVKALALTAALRAVVAYLRAAACRGCSGSSCCSWWSWTTPSPAPSGAARCSPWAATARRRGARASTCGASTSSAFVLCSTFAALGGVLVGRAPRLVRQQAGSGDVNLNAIAAAVIGGTSLFGGRGTAYSALLGIIVIQAISNGLTLLNLSSSLRYMILGGVLALAVIVD